MNTKFKRVIFVYDREENLISEIDISSISLEELKKIVVNYDNDPNLIMSYGITKKQVGLINSYLGSDIINDPDRFIYQIESYRID
ncbi:MAG TPA: hypothetical protein PLL71_01260 [Agriterribacter sp.]|nr:hypothetical protein [Agriterribacter sp.]HRQ50338.1 hypothetical protein [Agriterribacter sp.]